MRLDAAGTVIFAHGCDSAGSVMRAILSALPCVHRFVRRLKAGTVRANTFGPTDVRLPWGGSRDSGFGREHGDIAIENFTEPKTVWINTGR
jgi:acyl-CoA reductase-like NAD-dependent aldehyde dehydrogenase